MPETVSHGVTAADSGTAAEPHIFSRVVHRDGTGLWEHSVGFSHQGGPSAADEFFVVLSGHGRAHLSDGTATEFNSLPPGFINNLTFVSTPH